jgi:hypothetical protein
VACYSQLAREFRLTPGLSSGFPRYSSCFRALDLSQKKFHMCSFRQGRHDGRTKSCSIFVDLIHLTSCSLRRSLRTSLMFAVLFSSYQVSCLQEALWLRSLFSPTPVSARRMRPLPRPQNADFTSRHSWQIVAALPSCTRDESQEMRVQTSAKGLESE